MNNKDTFPFLAGVLNTNGMRFTKGGKDAAVYVCRPNKKERVEVAELLEDTFGGHIEEFTGTVGRGEGTSFLGWFASKEEQLGAASALLPYLLPAKREETRRWGYKVSEGEDRFRG